MKLAVLTPFRRRGIGDSLLSYALSDAASLGARSAYLEVRLQNEPAICLYRRKGFREIGIRKAYYHDTGDDALVMRLELECPP